MNTPNGNVSLNVIDIGSNPIPDAKIDNMFIPLFVMAIVVVLASIIWADLIHNNQEDDGHDMFS